MASTGPATASSRMAVCLSLFAISFMNSLCLPLLRDAERLDLLKLELPHVARVKKHQTLAAVRRPLGQEAFALQNDLASNVLVCWRYLSESGNDIATLTSLLRVLATSASSEAMGPDHAPASPNGNLQPWLSDRAVLRRWLCEARSLWSKAITPLVWEGVLPEWVCHEAPSAGGDFCPDLFCAARFGERVEMNHAAFAPLFAVKALPHLPRAVPFKVAKEWEHAFLALPAAVQDSTEVLILVQQGAAGLAWLRMALLEPRERIALVLRAVIAGGCFKSLPPRHVHRLLATLRHARSRAFAAEDLQWAMHGIQAGACPRWLAGVFRLAWSTKPSTRPRPILPDPIAAPHFRGVNWILATLSRWELSGTRWWADRFLRASSLFPV